MTFQWKRYYELAMELAQSSDEAKLRTAISRAYYAAYRTIRDQVSTESFKGDRLSHTDVWKIVSKTRGLEHCGTDGFLLKELREKADYDAEMPELAADCRESLYLSKKILYRSIIYARMKTNYFSYD